MPDMTDRFIGARIAALRQDRGLTQQGLAMRANVSKSLLSKVECAQKPASLELIAACARVLGVTPPELLGQPFLEELRRDHLDRLIQPIREALNVHNLGHDPAVRPRSLSELSNERDRLCSLIHQSDFKTAAVDVPALMMEAVAVAHESNDPRAWATLMGLDRVAFNIAAKFGFHDLSLVAAGKAEYAATRTQDPILVAMIKRMNAMACLRSGEFTTGRRLHTMGLSCLEDARPGHEANAAAGQMHLGAAILDARSGDAASANGHFEAAERYATKTGDVTPQRWLGAESPGEVSRDPIGVRARGLHWYVFGPTNVAAHRVSAFADQNEHARAIKVGTSIRVPAGWPVMRLGSIHVDLARSYLWIGRDDAAFQSLLDAQRTAPQQTRYNPHVRETIVHLRKRERSRRGAVAHFAEWVGV